MISDTAAYGRQQRNASIGVDGRVVGKLQKFALHPRGTGAALDVLLNNWGAQIRAAQPEPDSQGAPSAGPAVMWDAGGVFRAHGLVSVALDGLTELMPMHSLDLTQASSLSLAMGLTTIWVCPPKYAHWCPTISSNESGDPC